MSTRRVTWLEDVKLRGGRNRTEGDTTTEPAEDAARYIDNGWAQDAETGETGERKPGANGPIIPASTKQSISA